MAKEINFNIEARDKLKKGMDQLANAVKVTLGPRITSYNVCYTKLLRIL